MVAGGAGIALALMAQTDYKDKLASYNTAADAYANATASNEPLLRAGLNSAYSSLTSAHDKRSLMIYGALGIYVLNLADAFLLHSKEMRINTLSDYHGSSLTPSVWGVQGSLAAGFRFKHTW